MLCSRVYLFNAQMHGGEYAPLQPPLIAGRKGEEGTGVRGLARDGTRWPSGARRSQPSQTVQVAVDFSSREVERIAKTPAAADKLRRKDAERRELDFVFLCVFAPLRALRLNSESRIRVRGNIR